MNEGIKLDLPHTGKKPWPADAVMIVACRRGMENRAAMQGCLDATCRDCNTDLVADTRTFRAAMTMPERKDRPVMFFCVECAIQYDINSLDTLVDQRDGQDKKVF